MQRFKSVLFVAGEDDFTSIAYAKASEFAARNGAMITVMDVVDLIPRKRRIFETANAVYDLQDVLVADSVTRIEALLAAAENQLEPAPETVVVAGERHIEIIRQILQAGHDLVVVADAEEGYDSTTHHLLRKAPCPVWLMTPAIAHEQRILAAVDPNPLVPTQELLNDDVLALAAGLAILEDAPLHIVHAWGVPAGAGFGMSISDQQAFRDETLAQHRESLAGLVERHQLPEDTTVHFLEGSPDKVIRQVMIRRNITTIVMGTVARSGIAGLIIGNTAEAILRRVTCSVLAIKPEGFETPVRVA